MFDDTQACLLGSFFLDLGNVRVLILGAIWNFVNPLTPNDHYSGRTAPLPSKRCILYIYSTNICTEYFKHGIYSPIFYIQNAFCFIIQKYLVPVILKFYIQGVLKLKKNNFRAKRADRSPPITWTSVLGTQRDCQRPNCIGIERTRTHYLSINQSGSIIGMDV